MRFPGVFRDILLFKVNKRIRGQHRLFLAFSKLVTCIPARKISCQIKADKKKLKTGEFPDIFNY